MKKFPWGHIAEEFTFNFDGEIMEVVKYYPQQDTSFGRKIDTTTILYSCAEISQSSHCLFALVISWIAYKKLGLNQGPLVQGISKALELY